MTRPLHDRLDDLVEEASESPSTTYDVGTVVASCAAVPQGDAPVEGMVSQGTDGAIRAAGQVLDQQDFCAGLELTDFETGLAMLDRAAASGLVEAQVNYVDLANVILYSQDELRLDLGRQDTYRRKAIHYLNQAAQAGNAVAYANLSQVYSEGRLTPPDAGLAARYYREYLQRSGRTSERDLKHLEALEAAAD